MKSRIEIFLTAAFILLILPSGARAMSGNDELLEAFHPTITAVKGIVAVKGEKYPAWEEAREGMLLLSGDTLRTGKGSFAQIEFPSGKVEVYETTVVVIPSIGVHERKKDIREVAVEEGNVLFDINPLGVEQGFRFRTKNIQGGVKGTVFTVSYVQGGSAVNVYRGVVQVSGLEGSGDNVVRLNAGKTLRREKDSSFSKFGTFEPDQALENYSYNKPPGLDEKGLPADYNASPINKGVRSRGEGVGLDSAPGQNK